MELQADVPNNEEAQPSKEITLWFRGQHKYRYFDLCFMCLSGLSPNTQYTVFVGAINGVSDQVLDVNLVSTVAVTEGRI